MSKSSEQRRRSIYLTPALTTTIGALGGPVTLTGRLTRIADRYHEILARTRIQERFTEAEWAMLRETLLGVWHEPAATIRGIYVGVEDVIQHEAIVARWTDVQVDVFLTKLRALSYVEEVAVVEAVEQQLARRDPR